MYNTTIMNIFNNPKNAGRISKPDGIAEMYNLEQTAHIEFSLRIEDGIITDCKFRAQANPYIIAICSTLTEKVKGKMLSMLFVDSMEIKQELNLTDETEINFCLECVYKAVQDYKEKLEKSNK